MLFILSLICLASQADQNPEFAVQYAELASSFTEESPLMMEVEVLIPDSCFKIENILVRLDQDKNAILFHPELKKVGSACASQGPRKEMRWVNLGQLRKGSYELRELVSLKRWAKFDIGRAPKIEEEIAQFQSNR